MLSTSSVPEMFHLYAVLILGYHTCILYMSFKMSYILSEYECDVNMQTEVPCLMLEADIFWTASSEFGTYRLCQYCKR